MAARREKRRNKWYWLVDFTFAFPDGRTKRIRKLSPVNSRKGAEKYESDLRKEMLGLSDAAIEQGVGPAEEIPKVRDFWRRFIDNHCIGNNHKYSGIDSKESIYKNHLLAMFGSLRLNEIGHTELMRYKVEKVKAGLQPKTINNHLTTLYSMLEEAKRQQMLGAVPAKTWLKGAKKKPFRYLSFEEAARLLENADGPQWRMAILIALKAGLRIGELLALRWCDIDFSQRLVCVRQAYARDVLGLPKGGEPRDVEVGDTLFNELQSYRETHKHGKLILCHDDGTPLTRNECKWPLWRACDAAGLERMGWHVMRHTYASHLAILGAPIKHIQEMMGHTDIRVTMRYAHLSPTARRMSARLLDGLEEKHGKLKANEPSSCLKAV